VNKFLKIAHEFALNHEFDSKLGYNLCCVLVRGGSIVSVGYNSITRNSFVDYLSSKDPNFREKPFRNRHSEMSSILNVRNKIDLTGCKAYVVRTKASGGVGMARPCSLCQVALQRYGIKRAYYTINDNEFGVMNMQRNSDCVHNFKLLEAV
jgi:tRNA(Arg) A34 adenosine deaminase TadA